MNDGLFKIVIIRADNRKRMYPQQHAIAKCDQLPAPLCLFNGFPRWLSPRAAITAFGRVVDAFCLHRNEDPISSIETACHRGVTAAQSAAWGLAQYLNHPELTQSFVPIKGNQSSGDPSGLKRLSISL